jgi:methyltransferase
MTLAIVAVVVFGMMIVEARRASRNERAQRARGGVEPDGDVYGSMRIVYPGAFLAMIVESLARGGVHAGPVAAAGAAIFAAAKALKWWAIASLGPFWTFRVIVVPGARLVVAGPYRWIRHPNYVGVVGELVGAAALLGAPVAGLSGVVAFAGLLARRIAVEERALGEEAR